MASKKSCERCDHMFQSQRDLVTHLRSPTECPPVSSTVSRESLLKALIFPCKRCNNEFNRKDHLIKHLKTPLACPVKNIDIDRKEYLKELDPPKDLPTEKCEYCEKLFTTPTNKYRHQKKCPKGPNAPPPTSNSVGDVGLDIDGDQNIIPITTGNDNIVTITVNNYGEEDIAHLGAKMMKYFLEINLPKMIRDIHFDPNHPENMNLSPNIETNTLKKHANGRWISFDLLNEIHQIILDKIRLVEQIPKEHDLSVVSPEKVAFVLKEIDEMRASVISGDGSTDAYDSVLKQLTREEHKARARDPKNKKPYAFSESPASSEDEL